MWGPAVSRQAQAILSHAAGRCHLNRNYQLIGNPVLRRSVGRAGDGEVRDWGQGPVRVVEAAFQ